MATKLCKSEPIWITAKRFGYFPQSFIWHGRTYRVLVTEKCWTVCRRGLFNRSERLCFRVRCAEGVFELFQDALNNTWHMTKFFANGEVYLADARSYAAQSVS